MKKQSSWAAALAMAGAMAFAAPAMASPALVSNGSFETGDFSGWTETGDALFNGVQCPGAGASSVYAGNCGANFGSIEPSGIEQVISFDSAAGTWYLSFALRADDNAPSSFSVSFGGVTLLTLSDLAAGDYTVYQFSGLITTDDMTLSFSFSDPSSYLLLDDVTVAAVPEPASMGLMGAGLMGLLAARRRKRV